MKVFYKKYNTSYWHDISKYLENLPEWEVNINTELLEFNLSFVNPLDNNNNPIVFDVGDDICITNNEKTEVIGGVLAGLISSIDSLQLFNYDSTTNRWNIKYELTVKNRDFSLKLLYFDIKTPKNLEDILDMIFNSYTDLDNNTFCPSVTNDNTGILNGYTGGKINNVFVPKYVNLSDNIVVDSFESKGSGLTCLVDLLESIGYMFRVKYLVEPHNTNNINLVQQFEIFSGIGIIPDNEWNIVINKQVLETGYITNLNYVENDTKKLSPLYPAEKDLNYKKEINGMINFYHLDVLFQDGTNLKKELIYVKELEDTFETKQFAKDIVYCCRVVTSPIIEVINNTTFKIEQSKSEKIVYDQSKLNKDNMVCVIKANNLNTEYYRTFTISGNTVTLATPITGLNTSYSFELVNGIDIYPEDYPNLDLIQYGAVKKIRNRDVGKITFKEYDKPNPQTDVIAIYYYPLINKIIKEEFSSNIIKYGLFYKEETIDVPITEDQYNYLKNAIIKYSEPNITISMTSYRPIPCRIGYIIPIDLSHGNGKKIVYNNSMIVTSIKNRFISSDGIDNFDTIEQQITLTNYRLKLQDIIKRLRKAAKNINSSNSQGIQNINIYPNIGFN